MYYIGGRLPRIYWPLYVKLSIIIIFAQLIYVVYYFVVVDDWVYLM